MQNEQCAFLARYNEWMNTRLYDVCADLSDRDRKLDRGAFFGSIHGTLNHLLLADRLWLGRLEGEPPSVNRLDDILYDDFDELRTARTMEDTRLCDWAARTDAAALSKPLIYTSVVDKHERRYPMWLAVTHLFNHQTHHRGQLTTVLTQMGVDYGATDMIAMPGSTTMLDD